MFSPYYHWAGRKRPENHVAANVALYGPGARRWTMTERGARRLSRTQDALVIGPTSARWIDGTLVIDTDETAMVPFGRRVKGRIELTPSAMPETAFALDPGAHHIWQPIAPLSRVSVAMDKPGLSWTGHGYMDSNWGDEPLEARFRDWTWSRAYNETGATILYDARRTDGGETGLALRFGPNAGVEDVPAPPRVELATAKSWGIARSTRADGSVALRETLEDTPFYARSILDTVLDGRPAEAMHESLSLARYSTLWVKLLLPFRMPRLL